VYELVRKTNEVEVNIKINKTDNINIDSGNGFFDHLLNSLFYYSGFGADIKVVGDLQTGFHHSIEDLGIGLGQLFNEIFTKENFIRFQEAYTPMDEALVLLVSDISNRPTLEYSVNFTMSRIAGLPLELIEEFLIAFVNNAKITLHVKMISGKNNHHIAEALFKGLGRLIAKHFNNELKGVQSTKGKLL